MKQSQLRGLAFAVATLAATTHASATGDISCQGVSGSDATVDLNIGSLPILSIIRATISVGGQVWSTQPGKGETEIIVGQAAEDGKLLIADFTDPNVVDIVASLRLLSAEEGGDFVRAGTLTVTGHGAHAVSCEGP